MVVKGNVTTVSIYSTEIYKKNQSGLCGCALYYIDDTNQLLSWLLVETIVTSDNKLYSIFYEKTMGIERRRSVLDY